MSTQESRAGRQIEPNKPGLLTPTPTSPPVFSFFFSFYRENRDKIEMYLAFGASRFEACRPIAVEGLRLALLPTINQMSVIGEHERFLRALMVSLHLPQASLTDRD